MSVPCVYRGSRPASLRLHIPCKGRTRSRSDTMVKESPDVISADLAGRDLLDFISCSSRQSYDSDSGIDSGMSGSWSVELDTKQQQSASARPSMLFYRPHSQDITMIDEGPLVIVATPGHADDGVFTSPCQVSTPGLSKDFSSLLVGTRNNLSPQQDSPTSTRSKSIANASPQDSPNTSCRRVAIRRHHTISSCTSKETDKTFLWEKISSWEVTSSSLATYNSCMCTLLEAPIQPPADQTDVPLVGITPFSKLSLSVNSPEELDYDLPNSPSFLVPENGQMDSSMLGEVIPCCRTQQLERDEEDPLKVSVSKRARRPSGESNSSTGNSPGTPKRLRVESKTRSMVSPYQLIPRPICGLAAVTPKNDNDGNDLIGDLSRRHTLPLLTGKRDGCKRICAETFRDFLCEKENNPGGFTIIDCRYPYEYAAGHIKGAINLYTKDKVRECLFTNVPHGDPFSREMHILIFHCEFSIKRGPDMCKYVRSYDREINSACYPRLHYPEIYVLDGGYKEFYSNFGAFCQPCGYIEMMDKNHCEEMEEYDSLVLQSNKHKSSEAFQKGKGRRLFVRHRTCLNF